MALPGQRAADDEKLQMKPVVALQIEDLTRWLYTACLIELKPEYTHTSRLYSTTIDENVPMIYTDPTGSAILNHGSSLSINLCPLPPPATVHSTHIVF
jgi:hypothetical protein